MILELVKLYQSTPQNASDFHKIDMIVGKFCRLFKMKYSGMLLEDALKELENNLKRDDIAWPDC